MKRPLVLWKCLVSEKTVNRETLLEMIFSCEQHKMKSGFLYLFLHLKSLHISITNTIHVFICLVLPPPFLAATRSAPYFPQGAACAPSVSPPSLSLSVLPSPASPTLLSRVWVSVWRKAAWVLIGSQLLLTQMNCPVSALTGYSKVTVLSPDDRPG